MGICPFYVKISILIDRYKRVGPINRGKIGVGSDFSDIMGVIRPTFSVARGGTAAANARLICAIRLFVRRAGRTSLTR
jgi:hypothetical protein